MGSFHSWETPVSDAGPLPGKILAGAFIGILLVILSSTVPCYLAKIKLNPNCTLMFMSVVK